MLRADSAGGFLFARKWKTGISWLRAIQKATNLFARKMELELIGYVQFKRQQACLHVKGTRGASSLRAYL